KGLSLGKRMQWKVRRGHGQLPWGNGCSHRQRACDLVAQAAYAVGFLLGARIDVLVEEALLRQRAAEIEHGLVDRARAVGRRSVIEEGIADIGEEALQCDVADRRGSQQTAEQAMGGNRSEAGLAP